jgi:hypothetical protein
LNHVEDAAGAVDDDVGMPAQRRAIDLFTLERMRAHQDLPIRPCRRQAADLDEIVGKDLFQIGEETIDIGAVPSGPDHGFALRARLVGEAGIHQRKIGVDQKIAAPLAVEQGSPLRRREVEAGTSGQVKPARLHRLVIVECGMQPVAPEEIACQDIGVAAAADIGGHGGRRIAAFCRQHAALGVEHIERQPRGGKTAHQVEIGGAGIIGDQRIESEARHVDALLVHRDNGNGCPARGELIRSQDASRQVTLGVIDHPSDTHDRQLPGASASEAHCRALDLVQGAGRAETAGGSG